MISCLPVEKFQQSKFMSKPMLISLGVLLLVFGSGVALGLFISSPPAASDASEKSAGSSSSGFFSSQEAQDQVQANTLLSSRIRDLEKELADQKKDQDDVLVLAGRIAFFKKYHDKVRMSAFDNNLKVTPEMAEILGLTKEEQQAIEQHLANIKNEMKKLDDANTTLVKQTVNGVTYEVPVDPQGKALKDELNSLLTSDVGEDRAEFFMNYSDFSGYSDFGDFAQSKKDIEITWTQQNGSLLYTITNDYFGPNGATGSMRSSSTYLPPQYQKLLQGNSAP
jgi:hypothetical protein